MKDKENERDAAEMELSKYNLARIDERERHMVCIPPNYSCT
jgi:DNA repair protein RAD50